MTDHVLAVTREQSLAEVGRALVGRHISGAPVVDDEARVVGFISQSDVVAALFRGEDEATEIGKLMSQPPVVADEFTPSEAVIELMRKSDIHHLPVVRLGRLVGIITPHDVLKYLVERMLPIPPEDA